MAVRKQALSRASSANRRGVLPTVGNRRRIGPAHFPNTAALNLKKQQFCAIGTPLE